MNVAAALGLATTPPGIRRQVVALGVALLALGIAVPIALDLVARPVSAVRVAGEFRQVTEAGVEAAIGEHLLEGFFAVDVDAIRAAAIALPWVRDASVRRVWPGSVYVAITERTPAAVWNDTAVLEADGAVFAPPLETVSADLPRLAGPRGSQRLVLERRRELEAVLGRLPRGTIRRLELSPRGAWRLVLDSGVELVFGRDIDLDRLARHAAAFLALLGPRLDEVRRIDLRYANGFAVKWREPRTAADGGPSS